MSDFMQALVIGGSIFVAMLFTGLGRRALTVRSVVRPLVIVGIFAVIYLKDAPTATGGEWGLYAVGVALGLVFGGIAALLTKVERDADTGAVVTVAGAGFAVTWFVALASRLVFVWAVTDVPAFRDQVGIFMMGHQIEQSAIAPFFVIWALTMVVARVAAIQTRARRLPAAAAAPLVAA
ncbi:hypothetical protein [Nakamurella lactea]|uniref:hypothetical protein n=1 Tax=Nakamurella lactea TaxID=459515 RepID=UPI00041A7B03|nr:hypothetical protein [Nakamurella lactea]